MKRLELAFLLLTPRLCAQPPVTITESSYEQDISRIMLCGISIKIVKILSMRQDL